MGIRFSAITLPFFDQSKIAPRSLLKKCTHFGRKMGVATTAAPYGFWATNPTKKLAHWVYLLGQPLSRNRVFQNFSGEPPPPPLRFLAELRKQNKNELFQANVRVSNNIRKFIENNDDRVYVGFGERCKVYDHFHVKRCNNCQKYGHFKGAGGVFIKILSKLIL